jgi:hypothetical protein
VSEGVLALVASHPGILRLKPDNLADRLAALQTALGVETKGELMQVRLVGLVVHWFGL